MWDAEASVWVATSQEVPGLATEADTIEQLTAKLKLMIPELLEANGYPLEASPRNGTNGTLSSVLHSNNCGGSSMPLGRTISSIGGPQW
jgi:predicted RNase H-like HicB family nuclease